MKRLENGMYIIGFDNGYQFGKTAEAIFDNGVYVLGKKAVIAHKVKWKVPKIKITASPIRRRKKAALIEVYC